MTPAARQKPSAITDERIDRIVTMMLDLEWHGMRSRRELADEWGCHERTVGDMAERASAVVARRGKPIEQAIDAKLADLERLQLKAEQAGEFKDAIGAIKLYAEIRGFIHKGRGKDEPATSSHADLEKLSAQERIAMHKAAIAEEETKLKGDMH